MIGGEKRNSFSVVIKKSDRSNRRLANLIARWTVMVDGAMVLYPIEFMRKFVYPPIDLWQYVENVANYITMS